MAHNNNIQNLIPNSERSPEQLQEQCRKGGIASGEARRKKKTMAETINRLMELPLVEGKTKQSLLKLGLEESELNKQRW